MTRSRCSGAAITGNIQPFSGRVFFAGEDVTRLAPHAKAARGLILVPEGRQLDGAMSVEENLEMGALSARGRRRFAERLDQVYTLFPNLKERRHQKAGTFSGGEQQMLAIGRGIMSDPEVLIIDEIVARTRADRSAAAGRHAQGAEGIRHDHPARGAE